jgi:phosphate transport system ATP-binding protein
MAQDSSIIVKNLNVHIGKNHILKNINVEIPKNKITCIIGPSGCGKTTLFKSFNRLLENSTDTKIDGQVLVDGADIYDPMADVTAIRKKMGLLNQRPTPLPMSIHANIVYGLKIHGIRDKKIHAEKVPHYLKVASLWDEVKNRLDAPASKLSIGQQQRLCLARGLAVEPSIILGDEPTSALDPLSSKWIEEKFMELKKDYTIVMVTHILRQARRIADYVIFMYMGEIIEHGPVDQVLENPQQPLTKEYVKGIIS